MKMINCRTCLKATDKDKCSPIENLCYLDQTIKLAIIRLVPEMDLTLQDGDMVCKNCLRVLVMSMKFIKTCLKVETILTNNKKSLKYNLEETLGVEALNIEIEESQNMVADHDYCVRQKSSDCASTTKDGESENILDSSLNSDLLCAKDHNPTSPVKIGSEHPLLLPQNLGDNFQLERFNSVDLETGKYLLVELYCDKTEEDLQNFTCSICSMKFLEQLDCELHMETHVVVCQVCGKSLPSEDEYKTHVTEHIKICEFCGKSFTSIAALKIHIDSIHKETLHICDRCPRTFRHKRQVNTHIKQVHEKSRQQQCSACGKVFVNLARCRSHYRLIHQGLKPHACTICGKEFGRKDYVEKHQEIYHGRPRKSIPTKEVNNDTTKPKRRGRYGIRLKDPGKPINCKICDKQIATVHLLKLHLETHVKIKRHKCKYCELTFTLSHNRNRHEKLHGKDSENQFRCNICWKRVRTQEELEIHKNGHGKPKYPCDICGEKFHRRYLLHNHISDNHTSSEDVEKAVEEIVVKNLLEYVDPKT